MNKTTVCSYVVQQFLGFKILAINTVSVQYYSVVYMSYVLIIQTNLLTPLTFAGDVTVMYSVFAFHLCCVCENQIKGTCVYKCPCVCAHM